jgi:hypothetical protein
MQLDGVVEVVNHDEQELFDSVYFEKFPEKMKKEKETTTIYFKFTPTWWRYTDWKHEDGKFIIHSENIDVLDENGNKTGESRSIDDIHFYGFWHSSARVWIMNSKREILKPFYFNFLYNVSNNSVFLFYIIITFATKSFNN